MDKEETPYERVLTTFYKEGMISFLGSHPECYMEAIELAIGDKQPYSWRSAWLLWSCMEENDSRVQGYINKIIDTIPTKESGHQRELIKILAKMELNDEHEGRLFNICMNIWESIGKRPSVRYNAFVFILKIAKRHPELSGELAFITEDRFLETLSPGIKNSIQRMVNK